MVHLVCAILALSELEIMNKKHKNTFPNELHYFIDFIRAANCQILLFKKNSLYIQRKRKVSKRIEEEDIKKAMNSKRALNIFLNKTIKSHFLKSIISFNFTNKNNEDDVITHRYKYFYAFSDIENALLRAKDKEKLLREILYKFNIRFMANWVESIMVAQYNNISKLKKYFDIEDNVEYSSEEVLERFNKPVWFDKQPLKNIGKSFKIDKIKQKQKDKTTNKKILFEEIQDIF